MTMKFGKDKIHGLLNKRRGNFHYNYRHLFMTWTIPSLGRMETTQCFDLQYFEGSPRILSGTICALCGDH